MIDVKKFLGGTCGLIAALLPAFLNAHISGPDPGYTAAPGDNPLACSNATCHTGLPKGGPINAAGGGVSATFSGGGSFYTPGVPQTITVRVSDPVNTHFGFQMTARLESNLATGQAGDFTPGANQIVLCADGSLKGSSGCSKSFPIQYIEHSFLTIPASTTPYTFTWTPPAANAGNIHFYVAGNAVNNNNLADAGDHVYTNTYVLTPAQTQAPSVCDGCVLNAASFAKDSQGHGAAVAPGSLVQIYGTFTGATLADADVVPFSKSLGGASVTFGGIPAPMRDVGPSGPYPFINVQMPFAVQPGTVNVVVTVNGALSAPKPIPVVAAAPGIFTTTSDGLGQAKFLFVDTDGQAKYAAPVAASASLGFAAGPILRGQSGFFYANGLGVLTPPVPDGNWQSAPNDTATHTANLKPIVLVGGITAQVDYWGQAPFYPGVNQINIVIPPTAPPGDAISLQVKSADSTVTSNTATIAIR
jgi:uncharacterized protein (TIGR03437 family)